MTIPMIKTDAVGTTLVFSNGTTAQVGSDGKVDVPEEDYFNLIKQGFKDAR